MKAALFHGPNKIKIENIAINDRLDDGILLKILSCSVCSYDVRTFRNGSFKVKTPVILGHEICAQTLGDFEVESREIKNETRVSIYPIIPCLECWYCENKKFNLCSNLLEIGSTVNGGFAEYISIPKKLFTIGGLIPVPDNVSNEEASLIEPLACCLNGINQIKGLDFGSVTILGDGPIGLMQLLLFKKLFPEKKVTVVGKVRNRLSNAIKMGADQTVLIEDNNTLDIEKDLKKIKDNYSPNLIFVSNNNHTSVDVAFDLVNKNGKIVFFSGIKGSQNSISFSSSLNANNIHYNQISIFGSFSSTPNDMRYAMKLVNSKELDLSHLLSNTFALEDLEKAFVKAENYVGLKSVINEF